MDKDEVSRVVKSVMEGDEGREISRRILDYKDAAAKAVCEDGSSAKTISCLSLEWRCSGNN